MNWLSYQPLIGGMSIGAEQAFGKPPKVILSYPGISNDSHYVHYLNEIKNNDIKYLTFDGDMFSYPKQLDENSHPYYDMIKSVDVVSGVPVCSGLSMLNSTNVSSKKSRGSEAEQNNNLLHMTEYTLKEIQPKAFLFENAPGLYTSAGKDLRTKLESLAYNNGYSISFVKTNTFLHGIPQNRIRTFCIYWKSKKAPIINYYKAEAPPIESFLGDSSDLSLSNEFFNKNFSDNVYYKYLMSVFSTDEYRDYMIKNNLRTIAQVIEFRNEFEKAKEFGTEKERSVLDRFEYKLSIGKGYWDNSHHFINYNYVSAVIGKNMWRLIHPTEERYYSGRELMKFMGLPDDFELVGGIKKINDISQNVPVTTARDIHKEVFKFINGDLKMSNSRVIMQNNIKQKVDYVEETIKPFILI